MPRMTHFSQLALNKHWLEKIKHMKIRKYSQRHSNWNQSQKYLGENIKINDQTNSQILIRAKMYAVETKHVGKLIG